MWKAMGSALLVYLFSIIKVISILTPNLDLIILMDFQPQTQSFFHINVTFFIKIWFIYSWGTQREAETQAEEDTGSLWGPWCGTRSQDPGIMTWAEGRCSTTEPSRCPIMSSYLRTTWNWVSMEPKWTCCISVSGTCWHVTQHSLSFTNTTYYRLKLRSIYNTAYHMHVFADVHVVYNMIYNICIPILLIQR